MSRSRCSQRGGGDPNPTPVGKAGFDVWVLTKGGISLYQHAVRTILYGLTNLYVRAHLLFGFQYADPVLCVCTRYGPDTKCNPFLGTASTGTGERMRGAGLAPNSRRAWRLEMAMKKNALLV